ncbi:hypothetical protein CLOM_g19664 [Closterium sp. NIES-68]|nr:hypothetical protein CLOM_g19664 [Closterium sp. NIES-68]GJP80528.1 hypothetical protein CLOP_g10733 [Closterium sp. NIES-67]
MPLALQCILKVRPRIADFLGSAEVRHDSTDQTMAYGSGFSGIYLKRESHAAACWSDQGLDLGRLQKIRGKENNPATSCVFQTHGMLPFTFRCIKKHPSSILCVGSNKLLHGSKWSVFSQHGSKW